MPVSKGVGVCGLLVLKLTWTWFGEYDVSFTGADIEMVGGMVPGIGVAASNMKKGFANATLTNCVPATAETRSAMRKAVGSKAVLFMSPSLVRSV
jgi:hypothetical protein